MLLAPPLHILGKLVFLLVEGAASHLARTVQPLLCLLHELTDVLGLKRHTFLDGKKILVQFFTSVFMYGVFSHFGPDTCLEECRVSNRPSFNAMCL